MDNPPTRVPFPKSREQGQEDERTKEFGNTETEHGMQELLERNPIAKLGFDPERMTTSGKDFKNAIYFNSDFDQTSVDSYLKDVTDKSETVGPDETFYAKGKATGPTVSHEFTHRGMYMIQDMYEEDPEWFADKFGEDAARLISGSSSELLAELFDKVPEATDFKWTEMATGEEHNVNIPRDFSALEKMYPHQLDEVSDVVEGKSKPIYPHQKGALGLMAAAQYMLDQQSTVQKAEPKYPGISAWLGRLVKGKYAEGGLATLDDQMELFNEGELPQDPVSGNDIPPGSTAEEVRDDIDAKLSEGEYVVPADVVKYFGVAYFEKLRDKAKKGMAEFDQGGRIGGEPAQEDLSPEEMEELNSVIGMAEGGLVGQQYDSEYFKQRVPEIDPLAYSYPGAVADAYKGTNPYIDGQRQTSTPAPVITGYTQYVGPNNQMMMIPVDANGNPTMAVPAGFVPYVEGAQATERKSGKSQQAAPAAEREIDYTWLEAFHADPLAEAERLLGEDTAFGFGGGRGGLLGSAAQLNDIARVRGYARAIEATNPDLAAQLNEMVDTSVKGSSLGIQALDDVIATGRMYETQVTNWMGETGNVSQTTPSTPRPTGGSVASTPAVEPTPTRSISHVDEQRAKVKTDNYRKASTAKNRAREIAREAKPVGSLEAAEGKTNVIHKAALEREGGVEGRLAKRAEQDKKKSIDPRSMSKGGLVARKEKPKATKKKGGLGSKRK